MVYVVLRKHYFCLLAKENILVLCHKLHACTCICFWNTMYTISCLLGLVSSYTCTCLHFFLLSEHTSTLGTWKLFLIFLPLCQTKQDSVCPGNIGRFAQVEALADFLYRLRGSNRALTNQQVDELIGLWNNLSDYDKQPTKPGPRFRKKLVKGRFKSRTATTVIPGVDSTRRLLLSENSHDISAIENI